MPFHYPREVRSAAVALVSDGVRPAVVAGHLGMSTVTIYAWLSSDAPETLVGRMPCPRCSATPGPPADPAAYAHLLGLYLGDGCLGRMSNGTFFLAITCDDTWPGLADECQEAMVRVGARQVSRVRKAGCHEIKAYSTHWPCLFPQHGPGKKHTRPIVLEPWQLDVVQSHPGLLLRGLFHSDGWRGHNVAVHHRLGQVIRYRYSRYEFTNSSGDIRRICTDALDMLGIAWRANGVRRISVNRREAVAALDQHVGPKY